MTSNKKPGVAFWATSVIVVALVAYPLSFGPACWGVRRGLIPPQTAARVYGPILRQSGYFPGIAHRAIVAYAGHDEGGGGTFVYLNLVLLEDSLNL
jgi:hypothetical protein